MAVFDPIAASYDAAFTDTLTGRMQRDIVHAYLRDISLPASADVLELNAGTGADALFLASLGHKVTATDISEGMLHVAAAKAAAVQLPNTPHYLRAGFADLTNALGTDTFDLVFSNFGGLNCIPPEELRRLAADLKGLTRPGGRVVLVVMPRMCKWESLYFMAKFRFGKAFRRLRRGPLSVPLQDGSRQNTWYYSPGLIRDAFADGFEQAALRPVGYHLPPGYLDPFFAKRKSWLERLNRREQARPRAWKARFADHFLIELRRLDK